MKHRLFVVLFSGLIAFSRAGQAQNDTNIVRYHNRIDDLKDSREIEALIKSIDKDYANFKVSSDLKFSDKDCQRLCDSVKAEPYIKADFDNNGYTDLLVSGEWSSPSIICIFGSGKNKFTIKRFTRGNFEDCSFPVITTEGNATFIDYYYFRQSSDWHTIDTTRTIQSKKLIYKFGDFVEYNRLPKTHSIHKVDYKTTMCFGTCPVFNLSINSDRTAKYEALKFNKPEGKFSGTIDERSYNELIALLNYIDFPSLKNSYSVGWTDDQTCTLTITYDDGKTKTITDYGKIGTYGLDRVYSMLFDLRKNQAWK